MQIIAMKKSDYFHFFIKNVKVGQLKSIRTDILSQCGISTAAYGKWVRGLATPRKGHQQTINLIARRYGYDTVY